MLSEKKLARHWWAILIRGVVAIIFAILAIFATGFTLNLLLIFLGVYFILDGLFSLVGALLIAKNHDDWGVLLLEGIISLIAGVFIFAWPAFSLIIALYLIAFWSIITGIFELLASISASWAVPGKIFLGITGVLSIILGIFIFIYPEFSVAAIIWLMGIYALVIGLSLIFFGLRLRASVD